MSGLLLFVAALVAIPVSVRLGVSLLDWLDRRRKNRRL
jgi:hypothetical protein